MTGGTGPRLRAILAICLAATAILPATNAMAGTVEVFHADSLAGPMRELKKAFEEKNKDVTINLTSGVSKQLAERILKGDSCDVFAPSSPAVVDEDLMNKKVAGSDRDAAWWYVIFSGNEMVVITAKGNPLGIRQVSDLARPEVKICPCNGREGSRHRPHHRISEASCSPRRQAGAGTDNHRRKRCRSIQTDVSARNRACRPRRKRKRWRGLLFGSRRRAQRR